MADLYYPIQLNQSSTNLGSLRELEQTVTPTPQISSGSGGIGFQIVTGTTSSRLEEVKTYNFQEPYIVGMNGVQSVDKNEVVYLLDGITYTTSLENGDTTYTLGVVQTRQALNIHYLYRDERDVFIDKRPTQADILMQRLEKSVFDPMLRIAAVNSLDDLTDYIK